MARNVVCVRYIRGEAGDLLDDPGWCMSKEQPDKLTGPVKDEMAFGSVATVCGYHVLLPAGVERRHPTCPECKRILKQRKKAS